MRQQVWTTPIAFILLSSLSSSSGWAWQQQFTLTVKDPQRVVALTLQSDLCPTKVEISVKRDLIASYIRSPKTFFKAFTSPDYSELQKSWINEVQEALKEKSKTLPSPRLSDKERDKIARDPKLYDKYFAGTKIDRAKQIAKKIIYEKVREYWSCSSHAHPKTICLSQTIYNRDGIGDGPEEIKRALEFTSLVLRDSFYYLPSGPFAKPQYFLFQAADLGFVEVEKRTLRKARITFKIGSDIQNSLEPGAEDIKADNDETEGSSRSSQHKTKSKKVDTESSAGSSGGAPSNDNNVPPPPPASTDFNDFNNAAPPPPPPSFNDDDDF